MDDRLEIRGQFSGDGFDRPISVASNSRAAFGNPYSDNTGRMSRGRGMRGLSQNTRPQSRIQNPSQILESSTADGLNWGALTANRDTVAPANQNPYVQSEYGQMPVMNNPRLNRFSDQFVNNLRYKE